MSKKSALELLKEREARYREMARAAEQSAATSHDVYARTIYLSLAEGWLGFAERIAVELKGASSEKKEKRAKASRPYATAGQLI